MGAISEQWLTEPQTSGAFYTAGPFVPKPTFWEKLWKPWGEVFGAFGRAGGAVYEKLPEILFETGMEKLGGTISRPVLQGAGTTTVYTQPAQAGGAPASQPLIIIPPSGGGGGIVPVPVQTAGGLSMSTLAVIGIGLIVIMSMKK